MKKAMLWCGLMLAILGTQGISGTAQGRSETAGGDGPTGSWLVKGQTAVQGQFNVLMTFHTDGTMTADEPSAYETAGHGTWVRKEPNRYGYTFLAFIGSASGAFGGTIKVVGTLEPGWHSWEGPFRVEVFDPSGTLVFSDSGTFSGKAIGVERLN